MEILRNMWRRKLRSLLTIIGIAVGIFAFTVMGSMALRFNKMIDGGKKYVTGQITIMPKGTSFATGTSTGTLPVDTLNQIMDVEGVQAVGAMVELTLTEPDPDNPASGAISFSPPPTIEGMDPDTDFKNRNWETLAMKEGRMLEKGDGEDKVVYGYSVALDNTIQVGQKVTIRGREFEVIGIADRTTTGPDYYVFMHINPAREMYIAANPFLKSLNEQAQQAATISPAELAKLSPTTREQITQARSFNPADVSTMAGISWEDGVDPDVVADRIKDQFKNEVLVFSPVDLGKEIDKASAVFNAVILGSAVLALVVGGFSIINTMIMAISERTKEIGIKKALGAGRWVIAREYTLESGVIGFVGGLVGMGFGLLTIVLFNNQMASSGAEIFEVSVPFLVVVVAFSFVLGMLAGILPAWRAARLNVVQAIREL